MCVHTLWYLMTCVFLLRPPFYLFFELHGSDCVLNGIVDSGLAMVKDLLCFVCICVLCELECYAFCVSTAILLIVSGISCPRRWIVQHMWTFSNVNFVFQFQTRKAITPSPRHQLMYPQCPDISGLIEVMRGDRKCRTCWNCRWWRMVMNSLLAANWWLSSLRPTIVASLTMPAPWWAWMILWCALFRFVASPVYAHIPLSHLHSVRIWRAINILTEKVSHTVSWIRMVFEITRACTFTCFPGSKLVWDASYRNFAFC